MKHFQSKSQKCSSPIVQVRAVAQRMPRSMGMNREDKLRHESLFYERDPAKTN
jgi:hypothetical protein